MLTAKRDKGKGKRAAANPLEGVAFSEDLVDARLDRLYDEHLADLPAELLEHFLADILLRNRLNLKRIRSQAESLPSLSALARKQVAGDMDLDKTSALRAIGELEIDDRVPQLYLLSSVLQAMFVSASRYYDAHGDVFSAHVREASRVRCLEPYIVPLLGLFQGRMLNLPEGGMSGASSRWTRGGFVEYEVVVLGKVLFLVVEMKKDMDSSINGSMAHLFAELLGAATANEDRDRELDLALDQQLPIFGLLTDARNFHFISSTPPQSPSSEIGAFRFLAEHHFADVKSRKGVLDAMIPVADQLFSCLFTAWRSALKQASETSRGRMDNDSSSAHSKATTDTKSTRPRPSADRWTDAELCAVNAENLFCKLDATATEGERALELLRKSVSVVARIACDDKELATGTTKTEREELAAEIIAAHRNLQAR